MPVEHQAAEMRPLKIGNPSLSVLVRPDLGGRLDSFHCGKEWVWHPSGYDALESRVLPIGAPFDPHWSGGWEEMFPNDAAGLWQGVPLPDHGELWSQAWEVLDHSDQSARLRYSCTTVPVVVEKSFRVSPDAPALEIRYRFRNRGRRELPFHLKFHPALNIEPDDEFLLPPSMIEPVAPGFGTLLKQAEPRPFHSAPEIHYAQRPESCHQEFVYANQLAQGWCGLRNSRTRRTLKISFNQSDIPYVWMFQSFGKFRGHYVAMLEPCTSLHYDLERACREQKTGILPARAEREIVLFAEVQQAD